MSENRVIGRGNQIPWHIPEDFKWFKQVTSGNIIVMGRKTFESIGRPLPNRTTIIVSRTEFKHPGVQTIGSLAEIPKPDGRKVFICGGAQIYSQTLAQTSDLFLTIVKRTVDGDAFFPSFEQDFELKAVLRDEPEFKIIHYVHR